MLGRPHPPQSSPRRARLLLPSTTGLRPGQAGHPTHRHTHGRSGDSVAGLPPQRRPAITPPVTLRTGEPTCSRPKPHLNEAGPAEGPAQTSTLIVASVVKCGSRLPGMALSWARPPRGPGTRCTRATAGHSALHQQRTPISLMVPWSLVSWRSLRLIWTAGNILARGSGGAVGSFGTALRVPGTEKANKRSLTPASAPSCLGSCFH